MHLLKFVNQIFVENNGKRKPVLFYFTQFHGHADIRTKTIKQLIGEISNWLGICLLNI